MSWNIKTPGDFINGPLTVAGVTQFNSNVGVGAASSAWNSNYNAIDIGTNGSISGRVGTSNTVDLASNGFRNSAGNWVYKLAGSNTAARYQLDGSTGGHYWYSGAAGVAGNTIAGFSTPTMQLDPIGQFGVGGNGVSRIYAQKDGAGGANSNTTGSAFGACHAQASSNDLSFAVRCTGSTMAGIGGQAYATQVIANALNSNAFEVYTIGAIPLILGTNGVERARLNTTGAFVLGGGATAANGIGIAFPSAQSASTDANTLDDYEEGTFTATLNGSVSDPATLVTTVGRYTKIGRQVTVEIFFANVNTTGYSGRITVAGLPFFHSGAVEGISSVGFYGIASFTGSPFGLTTQSATTISMWSSVSGVNFQPVNFNPGSGQYLWANLSYTI